MNYIIMVMVVAEVCTAHTFSGYEPDVLLLEDSAVKAPKCAYQFSVIVFPNDRGLGECGHFTTHPTKID